MIPGPGEPAFDAALAGKARGFDRQFHVFNAYGTDVNADASVPLERVEDRAAIEDFLRNADGWDFAAHAGKSVRDVMGQWHKVAGAYAGVGIAADAFWYGTLRDQGASCDEVERARGFLLADLDALHLATAITGVEGVVARGFARKDLPGGDAITTTPLFDGNGQPLPEEKNNGTWRDDNSGGLFPNYVWEDSCSRDMLIGWVIGYGAAWEVIRLDPSFPEDRKARMQADAAAIGRSLMRVGDKGYDLEIHDADGRLTYHGVLNENAIDRAYFAGAGNGMYAAMSLGIVSALTYVARTPDLVAYVRDQLVAKRTLHALARDNMLVDAGVKSNFSNYNMAFEGVWLSYRYVPFADAREVVRDAIALGLYARPGQSRQPSEQKQTFYDFVFAASQAKASAFGAMEQPADGAALARGLETLNEFWEAPFWAESRINCDDDEIASGSCQGLDGTQLDLLGYEGRGDILVSEQPVPMRIRPASNWNWRSNPYQVNGEGDGSGLYAANDFRFCYWFGRYVR